MPVLIWASTMRKLLLLFSLILAGCDDGRLTLALTDAPIDGASAVVIRFDAVELEAQDGGRERFRFSPPLSIDVLRLEGGVRALLVDQWGIEAQDYRALRLEISAGGSAGDSYIEIEGQRHGLQLAAADATRLRIDQAFIIQSGEDHRFTLDFDLRKSIRPPLNAGQPYRLVPALRLVRDDEAGRLEGAVAAEHLASSDCRAAIYVYPGHNAVADDVGSSREPLNTGRVADASGTGSFAYAVGLLPAGSYTAALTCEAARDQPGADDALVFTHSRNLSITAGRTTTLNF